jgi:hypothetical protein
MLSIDEIGALAIIWFAFGYVIFVVMNRNYWDK